MIKEMVVKAYVIKKCLELGFDSWVVDWKMLLLSDNPLLEPDSTGSTYNFFAFKGSGIFIARSSSSSRKVWDGDFVLKFAAILELLVSRESSVGDYGNFVEVVAKFSERQA